jgi:hypothetical protein
MRTIRRNGGLTRTEGGATMTGNARDLYRELAYRAADGVEVVLFWRRFTDDLAVAVSDEHSGAYFELPAAPQEALDVFNHPYAHAAFRGLPYSEALLADWAQEARAVTSGPEAR